MAGGGNIGVEEEAEIGGSHRSDKSGMAEKRWRISHC